MKRQLHLHYSTLASTVLPSAVVLPASEDPSQDPLYSQYLNGLPDQPSSCGEVRETSV